MKGLTDKQKRFCDEYLIDLNATQAAIRAGYSEKTAMEQGYQLLQKTSVQEYIQQKQAERAKRTELTQDFVIKELLAMVSVNATDYAKVVEKTGINKEGCPVTYRDVELMLTDELTDTQKKALAVVKKGREGFELKPYDKLKALELLGKHLGMWTERIETDLDMNLNIKIDYGDGDS